MLSSDGTTVLTAHNDCPQQLQFVENLCNSLGGKGQVVPFEKPIISISDVSDPETAFDKFNDVSEGEYSCIMFFAEETLKEKIRKIEEDAFYNH